MGPNFFLDAEGHGEDEDDEPKTEEKSEDVLDLDESTEGETVVSDETEE